MNRSTYLLFAVLGGALAALTWWDAPAWLAAVITVLVIAYVAIGASTIRTRTRR